MGDKMNKFSKGDILMFVEGKMALIMEIAPNKCKDMCIVQYMDRGDESYEIMRDKVILANFGQSKEVLAMFHMTRSLHVRLNKFKAI